MRKLFFLWFLSVALMSLFQLSKAQSPVFVDGKGIMRWGDTKEEVYGFGVNYTVPFAHAYRSAMKLGVDPKDAIDQDVYHFARLGLDAYRVHVWDTEISDSAGNLLQNEHLDLFDYMLGQMRVRGMKFILTPIAFWGNGWPEPDERTPGFSAKYGKSNCLTNEDAIKAQENYLFQFLNHVNPHTGLAYKDDPAIVAFEVSNEPHHGQPADSVIRYIKKMITSMRSTGCEKPIFYNISHSIHLVDAYYAAGIDGGTFQWYPTGLGAGEELQGNFLPNVDSYTIPFSDNLNFQKKAKMVYEFDAADIGRSYIYPAIARSFRTSGIQWATHFSYDPTFMAYANTEYNTHFMNLSYTPQKALSLKISGEVFHRIPLYKDFGSYPENTSFDVFRVSHTEDLAEMVTEEAYFHTNSTSTVPPSPSKLKEVAGYGNSPIIAYNGTGVYFVDRIEKGVWRLEVMPDAIWVDNPFGRNSLDRPIAVINWRTWEMKIDLPDLGPEFTIQPINDGNAWNSVAKDGRFDIRPGTYLLTRKNIKTKINPGQEWKNIRLNEFFAPEATLHEEYVLHEPSEAISSAGDYSIQASVVTKEKPQTVEVVMLAGWQSKRLQMTNQGQYRYRVEVPASDINVGILRYCIVVKGEDGVKTYPGGSSGLPGEWDFDRSGAYKVKVVPDDSPIYLFNALTDEEEVSRPWSQDSGLVPMAEPGKAELRLRVDQLFSIDPENPNGKSIQDSSMRYTFNRQIQGRRDGLKNVEELVFRGYSLSENTAKIQIALINSHGKTFGGIIEIDAETREYRLPLANLKEVAQVLLPRPYPTFLPYYFNNDSVSTFDVSTIETLQISIGPGLSKDQLDGKHGVAIESVRLE